MAIVGSVIGAWVGSKMSSVSDEDRQERAEARAENRAFHQEMRNRLTALEISDASLESKIAGINSLLSWLHPELRPPRKDN